MDLIYKIYSVYLYDNQLNHDWVFFYNRKVDFTGRLVSDVPGYMFGNYDWSASTKIFRMDKNDPNLKEKSVELMMKEAKEAGVIMMRGSDFISLVALGEGHVSYGGAFSPDDKVELEGKYKGLKKSVYTPYAIMWNETKSGFNPHQFELMGVWKEGDPSYSSYRIWEEAAERESRIRDYKLKSLGI